MNLKGVLIDFGYTLAYLNEENVKRYREKLVSILRKYGYNKTLDDLVPILDSTYGSTIKGEVKDIYEFWKVLLKNLEIRERPILVQELTELRKNHVPTRFRLYDNVTSVLSTLRKKYKLALVSNCFVGLSDVLEALNLTHFFDCIVLSYEIGVKKPDKRIYLEALQRLKLRPDECVFVSDRISDLEGAREVGIKTILIRQGKYPFSFASWGKAKNPNFKPDFQCKRISQVIEYL
ncbi:MAG: HAD family hydrolase [Candidatus Bathyarchaeota archaeon]|nr:MAG: HAD family hydrolase [Candidatus Bathyarchaeota archaeon]